MGEVGGSNPPESTQTTGALAAPAPPMEPQRGFALPKTVASATCPKCRATMQLYDGADVNGTAHKGLLCPTCRWFIGKKAKRKPSSRHGFDSRNLDEDFQGRIRPRERGG